MWISRKRWKVLEKRIADLEKQVQSQQKCIIHPSVIADCLSQRVQERMSATRRMHMKETYTDEQKSPSTNEIQLAMDCATQHIREFWHNRQTERSRIWEKCAGVTVRYGKQEDVKILTGSKTLIRS